MDEDKIPQDFREALHVLLDRSARMPPLTVEARTGLLAILAPNACREEIVLSDGEIAVLSELVVLSPAFPVGAVMMAFLLGKHSVRPTEL